MEPESGIKLDFFISEKSGLAVVTLIGVIARETEAALDQCQSEVIAKAPQAVVLYLRGVGERFELTGVPLFARFQKAIRDLPVELRLSGLHPKARTELDAKGVLRLPELTNNLEDALKSLAASLKKKA